MARETRASSREERRAKRMDFSRPRCRLSLEASPLPSRRRLRLRLLVCVRSKGAAVSNAISYCIKLVILALYVRLLSACKNTWSGFSGEAFKELRQFAELAMSSAMMICLEWWSFEILVLLSGLLPNPQLETSVLAICLITGVLLFMVPLGLCSSISTRILNERDAGQPQAAKLAASGHVHGLF